MLLLNQSKRLKMPKFWKGWSTVFYVEHVGRVRSIKKIRIIWDRQLLPNRIGLSLIPDYLRGIERALLLKFLERMVFLHVKGILYVIECVQRTFDREHRLKKSVINFPFNSITTQFGGGIYWKINSRKWLLQKFRLKESYILIFYLEIIPIAPIYSELFKKLGFFRLTRHNI